MKGIWETDPQALSLAVFSFAAFTSNAETPDQTLAPFTPIMNITGCEPSLPTAQFNGTTSWIDAYEAVIVPIITPGSLVGVNLADLSRTISFDLINDPAGREKIKQFIINTPAPTIFQNCNYSPCYLVLVRRNC